MQFDILPRSFWNFSPRFGDLFDEDWRSYLPSSGLTIFEDEKRILVEAAVPGVDPEKIEVTLDQGILWIRGEEREEGEDKKRKYYRRASRSFSYRVAVPGKIDENTEPEVECKNGIVTVKFPKSAVTELKKLKIKTE